MKTITKLQYITWSTLYLILTFLKAKGKEENNFIFSPPPPSRPGAFKILLGT